MGIFLNRGTRKSDLRRRRSSNAELRMLWLKRAGIILGVVTFVSWLGAWFVLSDMDTRTYKWAQETSLQMTAKLGFKVENILVEGRVHSDPDVLLALINMQKGDPIFLFNPQEAKSQLLRVNWVRKAHVERRLPNTIYVRLEEKTPIALWKKGRALALVDDQGETLRAQNPDKFKNLIMVTGKKAPEHTPSLLEMLEAEPLILEKVDSAQRIENRRWNLRLHDGKLIKLPASDIGLALRLLANAQDKEQILDKTLNYIDLRDPGRMIIRTELGKVREYKTSLDLEQSL